MEIQAEQNFKKSVLFAIAMSLIGCLVYGILYYFGYIAGIGAYLIFYLACFGFKRYNNGTINKKGYIIIFVLTFAEIFITMILVLAIIIMNTYVLSFGTSVSCIFELMSIDSEFSASIISDLVISIIFVLVCFVVDLITTKRRAKKAGFSSNNDGVQTIINYENQEEITDSSQNFNNDTNNNNLDGNF